MSEENKLIKHIIDQQSFDDAVKENVEIFDMSPQEAIDSTIEQFYSQKVDLSNILTDAFLYDGVENHPLVLTFNEFKHLAEESSINDDEIIKTLEQLIVHSENSQAKRLYIGNHGGYQICIDLLQIAHKQKNFQTTSNQKFQNETNIPHLDKSILKLLKSTLNGYPDLLNAQGVKLFLEILNLNTTQNQDQHEVLNNSSEIINLILDCISFTIVLHEKNRELWMKNNILDNLHAIFLNKNFESVMKILKIFRFMCLDDDIRVEISNTHERIRTISDTFLPLLTQTLNENFNSNNNSKGEKLQLKIDLIKTISYLCVRNEYCTLIIENKGLESIIDLLKPIDSSVEMDERTLELIISIMLLMKTISGNDDVKNLIYESQILRIIFELILNINFKQKYSVKLNEMFLLILSTLSLRHENIVTQLINYNVFEVIIPIMKKHTKNVKIIKYGSWIIRNVCSRNEEYVESLRNVGGVELLQQCLGQHKSIEYDIKNAMKHLGDDVDIKLTEEWTGKGQCNIKHEF